MRARRFPLILALLGLLLGALPATATPAAAHVAPTGNWTPTASPAATDSGGVSGRELLPLTNGQVLRVVSVGTFETGYDRVSQRYDPAADRWTEPVPLAGRYPDSVNVALADGRALVTGGYDAYREQVFTAVERYDLATDRWAVVAPMGTPRGNHTATLLADGRVLVAGGDPIGWYFGVATATAEIYDPARDTWAPAASMITARLAHAATRLADGRVLVSGGYGRDGTMPIAEAEIYDPATDRWIPAAPLPVPWVGHAAVLLDNGQVFAGGLGRYDPVGDRWLPVARIPVPPEATPPDLPPAREGFSITALPDGQVLLAGGEVPQGCVPNRSSCIPREAIRLADTQRYDPATDRWTPDAPLPAPRVYHQSAILPGGRVLVVGGNAPPGTPMAPATAEVYSPPSAYFAETGFRIRGRFLAYWQANGGLARNGFPLSDERREILEDGNEYTVQYFERVRLELHPENAPPYDVLLGQFGRRILSQRLLAARTAPQPSVNRYLPADAAQPADPQPGQSYFGETGHNLGARFRDHWLANGGLAQFGFPLTEEVEETLEDGQIYIVQYFERARLEYHPENAGTPYEILLGQFGRELRAQAGRLGGDFGLLYATDPGVRERLGAPSLPAVREQGATQAFERGRMVYRRAEGSVGLIYVLCGEPQAGRVIGNTPSYYFFDTWNEDQDPGGGPAPTAGLFYPQRGFGKVWRERPEVRDCLGYARSATETGYTIAAQQFQAGLILSGPEDRSTYVLFVERPCFKCAEFATYERFTAPPR